MDYMSQSKDKVTKSNCSMLSTRHSFQTEGHVYAKSEGTEKDTPYKPSKKRSGWVQL